MESSYLFGPFFVFTLTKKLENQLSFSGKMHFFYTENKQTGQLMFFLVLVTLTKKWKMKNGMNWTLEFWRFSLLKIWVLWFSKVQIVNSRQLWINLKVSFRFIREWSLKNQGLSSTYLFYMVLLFLCFSILRMDY